MKQHIGKLRMDRAAERKVFAQACASGPAAHLRLTFLALACALASTLHGSTLLVTSTADDGTVETLRGALETALDNDTVDATGISGTILLNAGELVVDKSVTILGPGPGILTVDGQQLSRVFHITPGHIVTIEALTIANGSSFSGGGILNDHSSLTVSNCILSGNSSTANGGGIYNDGANSGSATLTVIASTVSDNSTVIVFANGGGIYNDGENSGSATLTVANSTLSGNIADQGGAIYNAGALSGNAILTIIASTLNGNSAEDRGGFGSSYGGGIVNNGVVLGKATTKISASTLSGNSADYGGGAILNAGRESGRATVTISASTLNGNSAEQGGGIRNLVGGIVDIGNSILKGGSLGENISDEDGTITSFGFNLSSDDGGGFLTATGDQKDTDPKLGPLADNGGPTLTHLPLSGSPAIDKGLSNTIGPLTTATDQRGFARTVDDFNIGNAPFGDGTDIGAVEIQAPGIVNNPPVARCKDVTVLAGPDGTASASVDNGSFDPDSGDTITLGQDPVGPYPIGTTSVTLTVTDSHGDSSTCTATVTVQGVADLAISKAVITGQTKPGQVLTYTIIVTNHGPNPASGVLVNDAVPQGTTFVSASPAPASAPAVGAAGTVVWSPGSLSSGASLTFTLTVKVSVKGNALIVNTATVTSSSFDPNLANNGATLTSKRNSK